LPFRIEYKSSVHHDLKNLDPHIAKRILDELEASLGENPDRGEPLTGRFRGFRRYRIGEYRVIYTKTRAGVLVLRIGHRSSVYRS
jgi:mRNA interferase RelE/StbE